MNTRFKKVYLLVFLPFLITCNQQKQEPKYFPSFIEMFSPKSNISLNLKNGNFVLDKNEFSSDQIFSTEITTGKYLIDGDILTLKGANGKTYSFKIESEEILQPSTFDTLKSSYKFLAWITFYTNGNVKQNGGWTKNNEKDGVWNFFDETGRLKNRILYDKGKVINNNFKFDDEK